MPKFFQILKKLLGKHPRIKPHHRGSVAGLKYTKIDQTLAKRKSSQSSTTLQSFKTAKRQSSIDVGLGYQPLEKKAKKSLTSKTGPSLLHIYGLPPPDYISVPTPEGYRNAIPLTVPSLGVGYTIHMRHCLFKAFSLEIYGYVNKNSSKKCQNLVSGIIHKYKKRFQPYMNLRTSYYHLSVNSYLRTLTEVGIIGPYGDAEIIAFCAATGYKVSLCKEIDGQWTWQHYPPQEMQDVCLEESRAHRHKLGMDSSFNHLKLHQAGLPSDGFFTVIVDDPKDDPRFRNKLSRQKYTAEMQMEKEIIPMMVLSELFYKREILGDGNCLYRSISMAMEGTEEYHTYYRLLAFETIQKNPSRFVPREDLNDYMVENRGDGIYGTNIEVMAFCYATGYSVSIFIGNQNNWNAFPIEGMEHPSFKTLYKNQGKRHFDLLHVGSEEEGHFELLMKKPDPPQKRRIPQIWHFLDHIPESEASP